MPITFETEWVPADEIRGPELTSTWASLLIRAEDSVVTRVVDRHAQTVRDHVFLPLYPLAESLVTNWWFLLHEVPSPAKGDMAFKRRHALVSARDGYAFPKLQVASTGTQTCLAWTSQELPTAELDFQGDGEVWIDRGEFRERCADLVERVIHRLAHCGVDGTVLQEEWASIQAADQEEALFCRTAAGLGWDPYALTDAQRTAVLRLEDDLDKAILDEAIPVLDANDLAASAAAIARALDPEGGTSLELNHLRTICSPPTSSLGGNPWQAGYSLAREVRKVLGLDGRPLPSVASLGEALREDPAALEAATQGRQFPGANHVNGVVAMDADDRPAFAVTGRHEANRRFHFCRGLAEVLTSPGSPALLTRSHSERQQRNRAFAAEFLAPAAALEARVNQPYLDAEQVDELSAEFGVSPWLVERQLRNHKIAKVW